MDANQRRVSSSQCRANSQTVPGLINTIDKCLTEGEEKNIQNLTKTLINHRQKLLRYKAITDDINATGEQLFGQAASPGQIKEVEERQKALEKERDDLIQKIKDYKSISEINARDFLDVKSKYPDTFPTSVLHVLEDYSIAFMFSGAVFFSICFFFGYLRVNGFSGIHIGQGLFLSAVMLGVIFMFMMYFL